MSETIDFDALARGTLRWLPPPNPAAPAVPRWHWATMPDHMLDTAMEFVTLLRTTREGNDMARATALKKLARLRATIRPVSWALLDMMLGRRMTAREAASYLSVHSDFATARVRDALTEAHDIFLEMGIAVSRPK